MICKLYRLLFWLIPVKKWQSHIIESHFSTCPRCREMTVVDETIQPMVVSPHQAEKSGSLWQGVRRGVLSQQPDNTPLKKPLLRWQFAAAVLAAVALIIPLIIRYGTTSDVPGNQKDVNRPVRTITLRSAKLAGQPAYSYVFNYKNPEITMIWLAPHAGGTEEADEQHKGDHCKSSTL